MKRIIKSLAIIMVVVLALSLTDVFSMAEGTLEKDPYTAGLSEKVVLDDNEYVYTYQLNAQGDKTIAIIDSNTGEVSLLVYKGFEGVVELNGIVVAEINNDADSNSTIQNDNIETIVSTNSGWQEIDEYNKVVSWTAGTTVQIVAGILAVCIPYATVAAIIASVSATIIQNLAYVYTGARIMGKAYIMYSGNYITYKNHWRAFLRDNSVRGPFDTMTAL